MTTSIWAGLPMPEPSHRFVTPAEDSEIQRQLANSSLTPPGSAERLVSYSFLDLCNKKIPEPRWLIEDILREGGAAMIYGPGSIGKSFFVHTLVLMAARGNPDGACGSRDINPRTDPRMQHSPAKVLIFDGEMTNGIFSNAHGSSAKSSPSKIMQIVIALCEHPNLSKDLPASSDMLRRHSRHEDQLRIIQECQRRNIARRSSTTSAHFQPVSKTRTRRPHGHR